ncbi:MAG: hypothetical protein WC852_05740, partial [Candidatus Nanoarchaeia archaeon]
MDFNHLILDSIEDKKHSLILGKPIGEINPEIIEQSKGIVIRKYRGQFFPLRMLCNYEIESYAANNTAARIVKLPKNIDADLCKIWGALTADGHITTKSKAEYIIQITECDLKAINAFQQWFENCFGIKPNVYRYKKCNAWRICVSNKIVGRYLVKILGFPTNKKSNTIRAPDFLDNEIKKKSFLIGVLTFDAGVNLSDSIEFSVKNEGLLKDVVFLLKELNIKFTYNGKADKNGFWRLHTWNLTREELKKWSELFENGSEKHQKILDILYGYKKEPNCLSEAIFALDKTFPKKNASITSLKDIFNYIKEHKIVCINELCESLKIEKETTIKYRKILKRCNIIKEEAIKDKNSKIRIVYNNTISS